jgi:DNA-damage-inducible protein J
MIMSKSKTIRARIEPELKHNSETVLAALGLSVTEAVTLFYKQISLQHGLPFDVKIPNDVTIKTLKQLRNRENLTEYSSLDDLKQKFK